MLPKTTPVTIRGDLEQRVTASGYLGASAVPVTPLPPAATPARARTHGRPAPAPARSRSARTQSSTMQASCAIAAAASLASPQTRAGECALDVESAGEVLQGRAECGSGGGGLSGAHEEVERGGLGVGGVLMASVADAATPGASRPSREAGHWYAPCGSTAAAWDTSATSSTSRWAATQKGGD